MMQLNQSSCKNAIGMTILILTLSGCSLLPWTMDSSESSDIATPFKTPKLKHIELGYSREFMHDQLGVPQISRSAQDWLGSRLNYERYQYANSEIQVLYQNNDVVAYTLRNYNPRRPELKRAYHFSTTDDKWLFGKSTFDARSTRSRIDPDYQTGAYRCRIEQTDLTSNRSNTEDGNHPQAWFSTFHANWQPSDKPTAIMMVNTDQVCPNNTVDGKAQKACLNDLKRYLCVLGKDGIG